MITLLHKQISNFMSPILTRHTIPNLLFTRLANNNPLIVVNSRFNSRSTRYFSTTIPTHLCSNKSKTPNNYIHIHPVTSLKSRQIPRYVTNPTSFFKTLVWPSSGPSNIFVVKKPNQPHVRLAMCTFIELIHQKYPHCSIIVTNEVADELLYGQNDLLSKSDKNGVKHVIFTGTHKEIVSRTDLIVSLGGDGTILRGVSMFSNTAVPPFTKVVLQC
ncbi:unnamed protein product [Ambrosiozyma monospora]|uniref:Unnamed protein product n=1 Tax=Ambrosiozyma monospora TaxID=43982 RepID=A0A9W6Z531_AMBMO|nr:unnamed protein product [Ambrosiozyma monospora]